MCKAGPRFAPLRSCYATEDALCAFDECCSSEGIIPALESSHALAGARDWARENPGTRILVGLSGRGDKDLATVIQLRDQKESRHEE